jgi:Resolvase, N terminal domain
MNDKIGSTHLDRRAVVYLRQSDPKQVREHRESTARQYALHERAVALGWPAERVQILDEDLGQSGASAQWRGGFQALAEDVPHARVGAIFSLEVARLARSSADWHRLLELYGVADVVLIDEQSVYTPRDFNDRLLLGLNRPDSYSTSYSTFRLDIEFRCEVPMPSRRQMYPTCLEVKRRPKAVRHPAALSRSASCAYVCLFAS